MDPAQSWRDGELFTSDNISVDNFDPIPDSLVLKSRGVFRYDKRITW